MFNDPDFKHYMFINAAAEFSIPTDPIRETAAAHKQKSHDAIRDLAQLGIRFRIVC